MSGLDEPQVPEAIIFSFAEHLLRCRSARARTRFDGEIARGGGAHESACRLVAEKREHAAIR